MKNINLENSLKQYVAEQRIIRQNLYIIFNFLLMKNWRTDYGMLRKGKLIMSMIENQISEMKHYIKRYQEPPYGREIEGTVEVLERAISTIQDLSAKLAAANMERSSAYYNGGWIPVEERLPNVSKCLVTLQYDLEDGSQIYRTEDAEFVYKNKFIDSWENDITRYVTAWREHPEPYKEKH